MDRKDGIGPATVLWDAPLTTALINAVFTLALAAGRLERDVLVLLQWPHAGACGCMAKGLCLSAIIALCRNTRPCVQLQGLFAV